MLRLLVLSLIGAAAAGGCQQCKKGKDEDCYEGGSCFSAGSQQQCLDTGGEYCVTEFSCEDCLAKEMDCFHKNWALPCYAVGWEEGCTKLGSQWCGAASALESADAVEPFMDGDAVDAGTELGEVLQWSLVSVAALALVAACVAVGFCLKPKSSWTFAAPIDVPTERALKRLDTKLSSRGQSACAACACCSCQSAKQQKERLLAQAAMKAAGGPEFWSLTVAHLSKFLSDHQYALVKYCEKHAFTMDEGRPKHLCFDEDCSMDHGDMPYAYSDGRELDPLISNMHVVVSFLIKPLTKERARKKGHDAKGTLGMWAFLTEGRIQRARTFVSHCWNEKFQDFVDTLESLGPKEDVWICSFALPQNINIGEVLGNKPSCSPFARALNQAEQVLLAVDKNIEPPTRSWCCFELYLACKQQKTIRIEVPRQETPQKIKELKKSIKDAMEKVDISMCSASNAGDHERIMAEIGSSTGDVNSRLAEKAAVEYLSACRLLDAGTGGTRSSSSLPSLPDAV
ncbi:unnamed protein product [Effrenium voratum]|nr:unnamed protein product [Effrenium voratum]